MTTPISVAPGTIVIFSDLTCPFAHVAVHRLFTAIRLCGCCFAMKRPPCLRRPAMNSAMRVPRFVTSDADSYR